jgi:hypothetical protein
MFGFRAHSGLASDNRGMSGEFSRHVLYRLPIKLHLWPRIRLEAVAIGHGHFG